MGSKPLSPMLLLLLLCYALKVELSHVTTT